MSGYRFAFHNFFTSYFSSFLEFGRSNDYMRYCTFPVSVLETRLLRTHAHAVIYPIFCVSTQFIGFSTFSTPKYRKISFLPPNIIADVRN